MVRVRQDYIQGVLRIYGSRRTTTQGDIANLKALNAEFRDTKKGDLAKVALHDRTRRHKETLPELVGDIDAFVRNAYPSGNEQMCGTLACHYIVRALTNMEVNQHVKMMARTTLLEALDIALHLIISIQTQMQAQRHFMRVITQSSNNDIKSRSPPSKADNKMVGDAEDNVGGDDESEGRTMDQHSVAIR